MTTSHFHRNPAAISKLIAMTLVTGAASYFVATRFDGIKMGFGWTGLLLTAGMAASVLRLFLLRGPLVTINEHGVEDRLTGYGLIPWAEIRGVYATEMGNGHGRYLTLVVDHPETYVARLSFHRRILARANAAFGVGRVMINFSLLDREPDVALAAIQKYLRLNASNTSARCRVCGYDLRATPSQCPECGTHASIDRR